MRTLPQESLERLGTGRCGRIRGRSSGAIRGDETGDHDGEIEEAGDVLERGYQSNVTVDREDASIAHATQGDHAEVEECATLPEGDGLIEGVGDDVIEEPIELGEGDRDDQITDDCLRDDTAGYFCDGAKAAKQTP